MGLQLQKALLKAGLVEENEVEACESFAKEERKYDKKSPVATRKIPNNITIVSDSEGRRKKLQQQLEKR